MDYLHIGAQISPGAVEGLRRLLRDVIVSEKLDALLVRATPALWLYPHKLRSKIRDYIAAPPPAHYYIPDFMNFQHKTGHVSADFALRKIEQVWNDHRYPDWRSAPKNDALVATLFIDLYADHNKKNMRPLLEAMARQRKY